VAIAFESYGPAMATIKYHLAGGAEFEASSNYKAANDVNAVVAQLDGEKPILIEIKGGTAVLRPSQISYVEVRD
jgi:hypothetical protein